MRLIVLLCLSLLAGGCNIAGMFEYAIAGPPRQLAAYKLQSRPTLVIVENYQAPSAVALDADRFARLLTDELRSNRVAPAVDPDKLFALRERNGQAFAQMKVSDIARAVGAEQVLYVDLAGSSIEQAGGTMMRGRMSFRVKVIEASTGTTLWPQDAASGHPVEHETPMVRMTETDTPEMLRTRMLRQLARRTVRLFYDWKPSDLNEAQEGAAAAIPAAPAPLPA